MDDADDAIATWSATAQARAVHEKEISSVELLDLYLDRIDRLDGPINAVVTLDAERARDAANAADAATMRGESSGPLHGLPVTIKDAIATEGIRSTGGAPELTDHVPTSDAPAALSRATPTSADRSASRRISAGCSGSSRASA
jgi:amidase